MLKMREVGAAGGADTVPDAFVSPAVLSALSFLIIIILCIQYFSLIIFLLRSINIAYLRYPPRCSLVFYSFSDFFLVI